MQKMLLHQRQKRFPLAFVAMFFVQLILKIHLELIFTVTSNQTSLPLIEPFFFRSTILLLGHVRRI